MEEGTHKNLSELTRPDDDDSNYSTIAHYSYHSIKECTIQAILFDMQNSRLCGLSLCQKMCESNKLFVLFSKCAKGPP